MYFLREFKFAGLAACLFMVGCVQAPPSLYQWESFEDQMYEYYKGGSTEKQIDELEQDLQKIYAANRAVPPGYHAHLGLLYLQTGNDSKAMENLAAERSKFPESASYIDFLLKKNKSGEKK